MSSFCLRPVRAPARGNNRGGAARPGGFHFPSDGIDYAENPYRLPMSGILNALGIVTQVRPHP